MAKQRSTHRSQARFKARMLAGAEPAPFPRFIEPQLATSHSIRSRPEDDVTAWFYQALDKVVRHQSVDDLRAALFGTGFDFAEGPGAAEQIEEICARSLPRRRPKALSACA